jgi:hypothetical protein
MAIASAEEILHMKYSGELFPNNKYDAKNLYHELAKKYHIAQRCL